ncbi:hypothetical protein F1188_00705 [Roseospira marina]|uniref:Extracellular solute-binding protein n=1 Tax=Roseospira marina TaxID=140057 RepID=A0A5M6IGD0_9PROT|nr:hypothetical protein [Roseospira marina]KAA5607323.1 hypothetical protein F1188_00705 [Roseospira marina]MBB4312517.1 spermidine/putrescine-binding protein [Roseospira marina]MBB5085467.1 spermidine/putrescine-binding protein [Roseospira marina]
MRGVCLRHLSRRALLRAGASGLAAGALTTPADRVVAAPAREGATPAVPVRVLVYDLWPDAVVEHLNRDYGLAVTCEPVASLAEVRERLQAGAAPESDAADAAILGLEDVAGCRDEGLLAPWAGRIAGRMPAALDAALRGHGGRDADGTTWLAPLCLGFDVLFGLGPAVSVGGLDRPEAPAWGTLLNLPLKGRVVMDPDGAVWMAMRRVDPDGARLDAAQTDKAVARDLFQQVRAVLAPYRDQLASVWTDTVSFLMAVRNASPVVGRAGMAWDSLVRRVARETGSVSMDARIPADGAAAWLDGLALSATSPRPEAARRLVSALRAPSTLALWCRNREAIPADPAAWLSLPAGDQAWMTRVLVRDEGWARLWFRPSLGPAVVPAFADARDRFEGA